MRLHHVPKKRTHIGRAFALAAGTWALVHYALIRRGSGVDNRRNRTLPALPERMHIDFGTNDDAHAEDLLLKDTDATQDIVPGSALNVVTKKIKTSTGRKSGARKHQRRHRHRRITPAPSVAPTTILSAAIAFPFNRPERLCPRAGEQVHVLGGRLRRAALRRFRVGPRKDLENFIAPMMRRLGMLETRKMDWQVYIGLQFKSEYEKNYLLVPNGSIVTSIPGLKETVGDKEAFSRLWRSCVSRASTALASAPLDRLCDWTTPSYNIAHKPLPWSNGSVFAVAVEGGVGAFVDDVRRHSRLPSTWIVKPQRRYLSLGMHLATLEDADLSSVEAITAWARREVPPAQQKQKRHTKQPGEFTIQRYIDHPGLIGLRKFDLRLWVFIASIEPLEVYLLDVAFPKISVLDYVDGLPTNTTTLKEKCMHILMMVSEFCTKRMTFPRPYPFKYPGITRPDLMGQAKAHGRSFLEELRTCPTRMENFSFEENWRQWQVEHWPQLERVVLWPLLLARKQLEAHETRIFGAFDNNLSRRYRRVALLSPDAIWDADGETWRIEEINTNGLFQLGADDVNVKTFHIDEGYTEGWLRIAGADGFPNAPSYNAALQRRLDNFCQKRECSVHDRHILERSAHQNAHATGGWYRLFPPVACGSTCGPRPDLADNEEFRMLFEPELSDLARKHWDFLRSMDESYFEEFGDGQASTAAIMDAHLRNRTFPLYIREKGRQGRPEVIKTVSDEA